MLMLIAAGESVAACDGAVRECMDRYGGLVWHIARRWSRTQSDAEDATQEIFLDIWRSAGRYDPALGSEKVFITTIARRRLIDRLRRLRCEPPTDSLDSLGRDDWPADPGAGSDRCTEADQASAALATLPTPHREVMELGLLHGMSHAAIAARLGLPLGTVKSCMRRGLLRVRQQLQIETPPATRSRAFPTRTTPCVDRPAFSARRGQDTVVSAPLASPAAPAAAAASRPRSPPAASPQSACPAAESVGEPTPRSGLHRSTSPVGYPVSP